MRGWLLINACLSLTVMYTEADAFWVVLEPGRSEGGDEETAVLSFELASAVLIHSQCNTIYTTVIPRHFLPPSKEVYTNISRH